MGSKIKAIQILQAAGYILLGLFLVLKPDTSVRAICYGCGVIAAAYGLLHMLQCRKGKAKGELILGVIYCTWRVLSDHAADGGIVFAVSAWRGTDAGWYQQNPESTGSACVECNRLGQASDDWDSFDDRWCGFAFQPIRGCEDDDGILRSLPADRRGTGFVIFAYRFVRCQGKKVQKSVFSCKKRHLTLTFLKFQECDL